MYRRSIVIAPFLLWTILVLAIRIRLSAGDRPRPYGRDLI
ncbi:hypothetical protein GGD87_003275 [Rhodobaca bogoriensis DSM 18756]|nr:hypothetical protein [Rhodobaca bogoriensis DSM 18756]